MLPLLLVVIVASMLTSLLSQQSWQRSKYIIVSIVKALLTGRDLRVGTEVAVQGGGNIVRESKDTLRDRLARYRRQDQRDRKKVQEDKLDSCLVRARRRDH